MSVASTTSTTASSMSTMTIVANASTTSSTSTSTAVQATTGHLCPPFMDPYEPYSNGFFSRKEFRCATFESRPDRQWDQFYKNNLDHFFKDRHWLVREFDVLRKHGQRAADDATSLLLDIGCGVGNASIPLIQENRNLQITAFDFSAKAISLFKANEAFDASRIDAFVHDIATQDLPDRVLAGGARFHFALLIFVLSAIAPTQHAAVFRRIADALAPGGRLMMRDYAEFDLAQQRFEDKDESDMLKLGERDFLRGDGTRVYFFSKADIERIVGDSGDRLRIVSCDVVERVVVNRKTEVHMNRKFVQCILEKRN